VVVAAMADRTQAAPLFLAAYQAFETGDVPQFVTTADLNRDGYPDVVVADEGSQTVSLLLGNGDGTLKTRTTVTTAGAPRAVAIGDLDRDGDLDLVVSCASGVVSIFLGDGTGVFGSRSDIPVGAYPTAVTLADL